MARTSFPTLCIAVCSLVAHGCVDTSPPLDEAASAANSGGAGGAGAERPCGELAPMDSKVVLAYLPTWVDIPQYTASMDFDTLTHVAVAFANPADGTGPTSFAWTPDEDIHALVAKAHENDVAVLASIAGAAESEEVRAQLEPELVDDYVEDLADFVERFELDGVDVDIEGGSVDSTYSPFVQKLAERLRPEGKLVTAAVASWFADAVRDDALFCFDFINVMSYDLLAWSEGSPQPSDHASMSDARSDLHYWTLTRDYPAERTVLGLPFYGYCWGENCDESGRFADGGGQMRYRTLAELHPDAVSSDWYEADGIQISLNSAATIEDKTRLGHGDYGGVMIWDISQDTHDHQLFSALRAGLD